MLQQQDTLQQDTLQQGQQAVEQQQGALRDSLFFLKRDAGQRVDEVRLPQYYRESFFSKDTVLMQQTDRSTYGIAGDPMPYSIRNDDLITGLLLGCFVVAMISLSQSRFFIFRQAKNFFYIPRSENATTITETTTEFRFQFFLVFLTCLLSSLITFFYFNRQVAETFILESQYHLIGILLACFIVYFLMKGVLYYVVNRTFFDRKKNEQWFKNILFLVSMEGLLLFPVVMLLSYFDFSMQGAIIYVAIVLILVKLLTFYKGFIIFFRRNEPYLQIILYFCALEIVPLLILGGLLVTIVDNLKINF